MRADLEKSFLNLPTVREFILSTVDILAERRSVIVLLPEIVDIHIVKQAIWGELWAREFLMREFSLGDIQQTLPLDDLISGFQPEWSPPDIPRTLANFMEIPSLPDVIGLWGIEACTSEYRLKWMQFIRDWASHSHLRANGAKQGRAICLIAHAESLLDFIPENDVFLEKQWWWGFPSILENNLLCRQGGGNPRKPIDEWREKLLPSLTGGNLTLIDYLWDEISNSLDDIMISLDHFCLKVNWTDEDSLNWKSFFSTNGDRRSRSVGLPPPRKIRSLWARGLVYSTAEFGPEINPIVLNHLHDREGVAHRIWRGQIELILPLVDSLRLELCSSLTLSLGEQWPWFWGCPVDDYETRAVKENPMATQLGHLSYLIRSIEEFRSFRHWLTLVVLANNLRNKIAHYCSINITEFERFIHEIEVLHGDQLE